MLAIGEILYLCPDPFSYLRTDFFPRISNRPQGEAKNTVLSLNEGKETGTTKPYFMSKNI
jgi:hypothetical protein